MSTFHRDRYRKKLRRLLEQAPDEEFVQLVWATHALQSGRDTLAAKYLEHPADAASANLDSPHAIHAWELETLLGQLFLTQKNKGQQRALNCKTFAAIAAAVNNLRSLENFESEIYLKRLHVLLEMHRIAQRQFPWQRGYLNLPQFYRYAYIFGGPQCAAYFEEKNGISLNDFSLAGLAFYMGFLENPALISKYNLRQIGISDEIRDKSLALLSIKIADARQKANELHRPTVPTAFQPNVLRQWPILVFGKDGERLRSPLPQLILQRTTAGVYYDLVGGPAHLRNEAAERFEKYCSNYISLSIGSFEILRDESYQALSHQIRTPDLRILSDGQIAIVAECKASKLTFAGQFSDDPLVEAKIGYEEISKGVFQIWRYFSHVRRGLIDHQRISENPHAILLTADTWLTASDVLRDGVIKRAKEMAIEDAEILEVDRKPIIFCPIQDLESTIAISDKELLLKTLEAARKDEYKGWILWTVRKDIEKEKRKKSPFPFDLGDVLPWWNQIEKMAVEQGIKWPPDQQDTLEE